MAVRIARVRQHTPRGVHSEKPTHRARPSQSLPILLKIKNITLESSLIFLSRPSGLP